MSTYIHSALRSPIICVIATVLFSWSFAANEINTDYLPGIPSDLESEQRSAELKLDIIGIGEDNRTTDGRTIVAAGDFAYVAGGNSGALVIWDVSNRKQPALLAVHSCELDYVADITLKNQFVFAVGEGSAFLSVVDAGNPGEPELLARVSHSEIIQAGGLTLHPGEEYLYIAASGRDGEAAIAVVDISNPAAPFLENRIVHPDMRPGSSFYQQGNYLYMSGRDDNSVMIFDASDATRPRLVRRLTDDELLRPRGITGKDSKLFVNSSGNKTIVAFDISDPTSPEKVGSLFHPFLTGVRMGALADNRLLVASWQGSGVFLIDVSDPSAMQLADSKFHRSLSGAHGIAVDGRYVYATGTITGGIVVLSMDETTDTKAQSGTGDTTLDSHLFEHHGKAVPVSRAFGAVATANKHGQRLVLIWLGDHNEGARRKYIVNVDTGVQKEVSIDLPVWDTSRGVYLSSRNLWYANFAHRFYEFDPDALKFSFITETEGRRSYALAEDRYGRIWGAQNPEMQLIRFDPSTREITDFGQINRENWPQYARTIALDEQGWVYAGIGAVNAQIVGFYPETGETRKYIPEDRRTTGSGRVILGTDNRVYAHAPEMGWFLLANGDALPIDSMPVDPAPLPAGYHSTAVDRFPDGSRISTLDVPNRTLVIEEEDGSLKEFTLDYDAPGARIYSMTLGSDGAIYGGTGQPTHVFRYDTKTGELTEEHMYPGNHLNAMITRGDFIYAAHYSGARIYWYDITRPWMPDNPENPNPAAFPGNALPELRRPAVLEAHPDERHLVMGGTPRGGRSAGGLYIFDLENIKGEIIPHQDLVENLSTKAIVFLPDGNLLGAASARPGTGGEKVADEAALYIMDWETRNVLWHDVILPGREEIPDIIEGPDGLIYGIADDATFFVFEPETRKVIHEESLAHYGLPAGSQAPRILTTGPDGTIYILFRRAIIALTPKTFEHHKFAESPVEIETGIIIHKGRLYFSTMTDLWSIQIPE